MRKPPPDPPEGLKAVPPGEWMQAWARVIAQPSVKNIGCWCAFWADYKDGSEIRPGNALLARVAGGLSEKTVIDALKLIRDEWGMLWRYFEGRKAGRGGFSDTYRLTIPDDILARVPLLSPEYRPVDDQPGTPELRTGELRTPVLSGPEHLNSVPRTPELTSGHLTRDPYGVPPNHSPSHNPSSVAGASVEGSKLSTGEPSASDIHRRRKALAQTANSRETRNNSKGALTQ